MNDFLLRVGRPTDAVALASVHAAAFPDYFQTHMGPGFLRRFYTAFLGHGHLVVVAEREGRVVGLVAGTGDLARFRRDLYPPNLLPFAGTFATKVITDQVVRRSAWSRLGHLRIAVRALFERRKSEHSADMSQDRSTMYLFSICVDPAEHGKGIAAPLLAEFNRLAALAGAEQVELTVLDDNARAIRFYEREGWIRGEHEGKSYAYVLDLA